MIPFIALEGVAGAGDELVGVDEGGDEVRREGGLEGVEEGVDLGAEGGEESEGGVAGGGGADLDGCGDFREVDSLVVAGAREAVDVEGVGSGKESLGVPHEVEGAVVEGVVAEANEGGEGAEVLVEEGAGGGADGLVEGAVDEGDVAVVEGFLIGGGELVCLGEGVVFFGGDEGEVPELFGVACDEGPFGAVEEGEGGGEVALGGFIDDGEIEEAGLEGEDAVEVVGGGDPDREDAEEGGGVDGLEGGFLF